MGKLRELLAGYLYRFIIGFLSRELYRLAGDKVGLEAEGNNTEAIGGRIPHRSTTRNFESGRAYRSGLDRIADEYAIHNSVFGNGTRGSAKA